LVIALSAVLDLIRSVVFTALRVLRKERALLLKSKIIEDYPEIYEFLELNERVTEELVKEQPFPVQNFFDNVYPDVRNRAKDEWYATRVRVAAEGEIVKCSLCNRTIENICYISNDLTNEHLIVGSRCVQHFRINTDKIGADLERILSGQMHVRRLNRLNTRIPGIRKTVEGWKTHQEQYPILVEFELAKQFDQVTNRAEQLLQDYFKKRSLRSKDDEAIIAELQTLEKQQSALIAQMNLYVEERKGKKHAPTMKIARHLKSRGLHGIVEQLQKDEAITWPTARYIDEPDFMQYVASALSKPLEVKGLSIKADIANNRHKGYMLEHVDTKSVQLFSSHSDLVLSLGGLIFDEPLIDPMSLSNIISISNISKLSDAHRRRSAETVVRNLATKTRTSDVWVQDYDYSLNEVVLYDGKAKKYVKGNLLAFIDTFKGLVFGVKGKTVSDMARYASSLPGSRYTRKELNELEQTLKDFNKRPGETRYDDEETAS
jgi:hypothetical protein